MKAIVNANVVLPDRIVPNGTILFDNGKILASGCIEVLADAEIIDAGGLYAGPGLIDEHSHGYHWKNESIDVCDNCEAVAAGHLRHGTTTFTPSAAYSLPYGSFVSVIRQCNAAIEKGGTTIAGIHFEGPFTNPDFGSVSTLAWTYSKETCEELFDLAGKNVLHCTYAPELDCAPEIEKILVERGVIGDIGHTCASPEDVERAVAHGARIVTHLFDAMGHHLGPAEAAKMTGDVQDSSVVAVLATPGLYYELICDSMCAHVKKTNMNLALRAAGEDNIILITDASVDAHGDNPEAPPAELAGAEDLNFDVNGDLSGSYLTMDRACANFMRMTGADIRVAFKCASTNPAKALRLFDCIGSLDAGKEANIVLADAAFNLKAVYFRGNQVEGIRG